jgi:uncharacterized protein
MISTTDTFQMNTPVHDAERARLAKKDWIQSASGKQVTPLHIEADQVCIEDIAHALAQKNRFTGHAKFPYSVAQHSVLVSRLVPAAFALPALLHDAAEAYLPDLAAPIKRKFWYGPSGGVAQFSHLESVVLDVIFSALGLSALRAAAESEQVKRADLVALATECRDVMGPPPEDWGLTERASELCSVREMGWFDARDKFLARFKELTR